MPKVAPIQTSFNAGEFSPLVQARVEADRYKAGCAIVQNYIPSLQGALARRTGTKYAAVVKDSTKSTTRLIPFKFSVTQAYILEFGDRYIRFYADNGQVITTATTYTVESFTSPFFMHQWSVRQSNVVERFESDYLPPIISSVASGVTFEVKTPYLEADLSKLKFTQNADTLYITHPTYPTYKLTRQGHTAWTMAEIQFIDGPYLPIDRTGISLIPSAATSGFVNMKTGGVTITGAANNGAGLIRITSAAHGFSVGMKLVITGVTGTVEANNFGNTYWVVKAVSDVDHFDLDASAFVHAYVAGGEARRYLFQPTDLGRSIRLQEIITGTPDVSTWVWGIVTGITDGAHIQFYVPPTGVTENAFTTATGHVIWRWGLWSATTGYPSACTFHQDRLGFAGSAQAPQRIDLSVTSDYENFQPSSREDSTVASSDSCSYLLNSTDVNAVRWIASDEKALLAGTSRSEWTLRPSTTSEAITPTNVNASSSTRFGSADISPIQAGKATMFISRAGRKLREMTYFYQADGFRAPDLSEISEHITAPSVTALEAVQEPQSLVFALRSDGVLACMTYDRDDTQLRAGWSRQILGGASDSAGTNPVVESIAVIPSPDATFDQLWLIVKRYINGATVRTIEYLTKPFDDLTDQEDAYFVDCGATYNAPLTVTGITKANPAVVTSAAHGLSNGNQILINGVVGMTEVNDQIYKIANVTTNTFSLVNVNDGTAISSSAFTTYISGGVVRKMVTTISGLTWLENETVSIYADGAVHRDAVVSNSGVLTLDYPVARASIGFGYVSDGQRLRDEAGAADGTSIGKTRRTNRVGFMLHRTGGIQIGMSFDNLTPLNFRQTSDTIGRGVPLFSGIESEIIEADYDFENQICWRQDEPVPGLIQAIMPQMTEQDR